VEAGVGSRPDGVTIAGDGHPAVQGAAPLDPAPDRAAEGEAGRRTKIPGGGMFDTPAGPYRDERASYDPVGTPHRLDESDQDGYPSSRFPGAVGGGATRLGRGRRRCDAPGASSTEHDRGVSADR